MKRLLLVVVAAVAVPTAAWADVSSAVDTRQTVCASSPDVAACEYIVSSVCALGLNASACEF